MVTLHPILTHHHIHLSSSSFPLCLFIIMLHSPHVYCIWQLTIMKFFIPFYIPILTLPFLTKSVCPSVLSHLLPSSHAYVELSQSTNNHTFLPPTRSYSVILSAQTPSKCILFQSQMPQSITISLNWVTKAKKSSCSYSSTQPFYSLQYSSILLIHFTGPSSLSYTSQSGLVHSHCMYRLS